MLSKTVCMACIAKEVRHDLAMIEDNRFVGFKRVYREWDDKDDWLWDDGKGSVRCRLDDEQRARVRDGPPRWCFYSAEQVVAVEKT